MYVCTVCVQVKYYRDTYAEHPEDRKNIEYTVHLDNDQGRKFLVVVMVNSWINKQSRLLIGRSISFSQSGARLAH